MKKREVKDFLLYSTAVICICWKNGSEEMFMNVDLDLAMMLKMMKIEGISAAEVQRCSDAGEPLSFKKVTLYLFEDPKRPNSFYTSEAFDDEDDPMVFHVELKED